jgi:hypothetical protein
MSTWIENCGWQIPNVLKLPHVLLLWMEEILHQFIGGKPLIIYIGLQLSTILLVVQDFYHLEY